MSRPSSSISHRIPIEIVQLIIRESSFCPSTLKAWSSVSLGCLSIAGPLLNQDVRIPDNNSLDRIIRRVLTSDLELGYLPRLVRGLSLKKVANISLYVEPSLEQVDAIYNSLPPPSRRSKFLLCFAFQPSTKDELAMRGFIAPRLVLLLRPRSLTDGSTGRDGTPIVLTSLPMRYYLAGLRIDRLMPIELLSTFSADENPLCGTYESSFALQDAQNLLRNRFARVYDQYGPGLIRAKNLEALSRMLALVKEFWIAELTEERRELLIAEEEGPSLMENVEDALNLMKEADDQQAVQWRRYDAIVEEMNPGWDSEGSD